MKLATVRNALIKQTIIVGAVIAVVVAPVLYLDSMSTNYDAEIQKNQAQSDAISKELITLLSQSDNANGQILAYNEIKQKQDKKLLTISKTTLRDAILLARKKYKFENFDVDMGAIKTREGEKYKLATVFTETSDINIKLSASSDLDVFALMRSLQESFSTIRFTKLKLTLAKDLDNTALLAIRNTGFAPLVNGEIVFTWSGIKNVKNDEPEPSAKKEEKPTEPAPQNSVKPGVLP